MPFYTGLIFIIFMSITACSATESENNMATDVFSIKIGDTTEEYSQRNHLKEKLYIDKQPAGMSFHEKDWDDDSLGTVELIHGKHSFIINNVMSLTGSEDLDFQQNGIDNFRIKAGITKPELIGHTEALTLVHDIFKDLLSRGWKPLTENYDPRLQGRESYEYLASNIIYSPDPSYLLSLDEWMALGSHPKWNFFAEDVFLTVAFHRDTERMDPAKDGAYLLSYRIFSVEQYAKGHFVGDKRNRWQDLWVDMAKEDKQDRYKTEKRLIEKGYHINTDYEDPKVHPDDPVEP